MLAYSHPCDRPRSRAAAWPRSPCSLCGRLRACAGGRLGGWAASGWIPAGGLMSVGDGGSVGGMPARTGVHVPRSGGDRSGRCPHASGPTRCVQVTPQAHRLLDCPAGLAPAMPAAVLAPLRPNTVPRVCGASCQSLPCSPNSLSRARWRTGQFAAEHCAGPGEEHQHLDA